MDPLLDTHTRRRSDDGQRLDRLECLHVDHGDWTGVSVPQVGSTQMISVTGESRLDSQKTLIKTKV